MRERERARTGTSTAAALAALLVSFGSHDVALAQDRAAAASPRPSPAVGASGSEAALTVTVHKVQPVAIKRSITASGGIFAWQEAVIGSEVGGYRVAEVRVDIGDAVEKGQVLIELATPLLAAEVATKRAVLAQRQAELDNAHASLRRAEAMSVRDLVAEADLDRVRSEASAAEARLESARADLQTSALRLQFAQITAPDDGVITSRTVSVGDIAQVGGEMLRLLRGARIEWRGEIPEARLAELVKGQTVVITTADGTRLEGEIRVVAPTVAAASRTGLVYVDLPADPRVRPGMFARGEIEIGRGDALVVPLESFVSADGYHYVFVLREDGTVERRRIETGGVHGASIEVLAGLRAGETIVERGAGFLKDGDLVAVR